MKVRSVHPGDVNWRRIVASGGLWAVVYNLIWGIAWFAFMRREWLDAAVDQGQPVPWTAEVWFIWVTLTVPLGIAVMAHCASGGTSPWKAIVASMVVWLPFAVGMVVWGIQESFSTRVLALDSLVNFAALVAAALIGAWSLGPVPLGLAGAAPGSSWPVHRRPSGGAE